ncbi:hypothetical protein GN244_ATG15112 [Phytophthora infestans]|uniref:Uncharacterized protein n=1 Tax=Phytophthora infestans TaxID=4787 RepID=A0A833VXN9_PHYIN|nr:hypothetical protein GN244_ATG15112 [Phytophthora infestans]
MCEPPPNLAVMEYMESYEDLLDKVQLLMQKNKLRSVLRQTTRWSSTFKMVCDLEDGINAMDDATTALLPSWREEKQLWGLLEELNAFEYSSKKLQSADGLSLLDVRDTLSTR